MRCRGKVTNEGCAANGKAADEWDACDDDVIMYELAPAEWVNGDASRSPCN